MIPVTTAGPAGWPPMSRMTTADMMAAAIPAQGQPERPPAGDAGRQQPAAAGQPGHAARGPIGISSPSSPIAGNGASRPGDVVEAGRGRLDHGFCSQRGAGSRIPSWPGPAGP
jgi:hypothetical protein